MSNPAPILLLSGEVRDVRRRDVEPVEARPAQYDEAGNFLKAAVDARPGYSTTDVLVLTDSGGFLTLVYSDDAANAAGGLVPSAGDRLELLPLRTYRKWEGQPGRRYQVTGYSAASELVHVDCIKSGSTGTRSLSAAAS